MCEKSDFVELLRRRSTFKPLFTSQRLSMQSQLFNGTSIAKYSYINKSPFVESNQISFQRDGIQRSITLPFIHDVDSKAILQAVDEQSLEAASLIDGKMHGLNLNCYFLSMNVKITSTAQHDISCFDDPKERTHQVAYDCMNRNARRGKRANKGKRACSRQNRRKRRRRFGNHRR